MHENQVPRLDGWLSFAEAAHLLNMTKQGVHRLVFSSAARPFNVERDVRAVGEQPILLLRVSAVQQEVRRRRARELVSADA